MPWGFQEFEAPRFQENRHIKVVRLSVIGTARLYPQEIFLELISLTGWVNPMATVRLDRLCQWKIPMIPSGIEPATFRLVAQCLNQLRHCVPPYNNVLILIFIHCLINTYQVSIQHMQPFSVTSRITEFILHHHINSPSCPSYLWGPPSLLCNAYHG
jgi:hypothetical protein